MMCVRACFRCAGRCGFINAVLAAAGDATDARVRALLAAFMALESRLAK